MMGMESRVQKGSVLHNNPVAHGSGRPFIRIPGNQNGKQVELLVTDDVLSRHSMFIGSTGCGKSNSIFQFVDFLKNSLTSDDVMIVFDTKGDYIKEFFNKEKDLLIGNSAEYRSKSQKWNLLLEITGGTDQTKWQDNEIKLQADELCRSFFEERVKHTTNAFFPNAARAILVGIIIDIIRSVRENPADRTSFFHNDGLRRILIESSIEDICNSIHNNPDMRYLLSYIDGNGEQSLGVISEMYSVINELLVGIFAERGIFSIKNFVRQRGGKTLFIEYDLGLGNSLTPIYRTLIDLALKETLSRSTRTGNVYVICDEFRLLPYLQHIDDAVNFGRSYGLKIIAGLQSIEQMYEVYGTSRARNIISGFSSVYAFRANDSSTREFYTGMHGKNIVLEQYQMRNGSITEEKRIGYVIEDWDVKALQTGEAIITFPERAPFLFHFKEYTPRKQRVQTPKSR